MQALKQLKQRIGRVRPCRKTNQVVLPHDNTRPPTGVRTRVAVATVGWTVLRPPPYGPDLAPIDFCLFGPLKEALRGRRVVEDDELNHSVCEELFSKEFNATGIQSLTQRWKMCVNSGGDFVIILSETKMGGITVVPTFVCPETRV